MMRVGAWNPRGPELPLHHRAGRNSHSTTMDALIPIPWIPPLPGPLLHFRWRRGPGRGGAFAVPPGSPLSRRARRSRPTNRSTAAVPGCEFTGRPRPVPSGRTLSSISDGGEGRGEEVPSRCSQDHCFHGALGDRALPTAVPRPSPAARSPGVLARSDNHRIHGALGDRALPTAGAGGGSPPSIPAFNRRLTGDKTSPLQLDEPHGSAAKRGSSVFQVCFPEPGTTVAPC